MTSQEVDLYRERVRGCDEIAAKKAVVMILGCYAQQRLNSPKVFTRKLADLFQKYPSDIVDQVIDRHPEKYNWLNIAEVSDELKDAMKPRWQALKDAHYRLKQSEYAEVEETPEERQLMAKKLGELVAGLKAKKRLAEQDSTHRHANKQYDEERRKGNAALIRSGDPECSESSPTTFDLGEPRAEPKRRTQEDFSQHD